jgi:molybdopterin molybdotransferase
VSRTLYAGDLPGEPVAAGEAVRIFTGAPLPPGADAVVREESTEARGGRVLLRHAARPGENVRAAGEDVAQGAEALPAGVRLGARQLALLAAVGCERVRVHRAPRVALLSTGDELVKGRTPDTNGVALAGLLAEMGADVRRGAVGDDPAALRAAISGAAAAADAVVTIGGVSVGEKDLVAGTLRALGAEVLVHGVPMKPGKPFLFALLGGRPVLGLPGSPSACLVAFEVFARPALLRLSGAARVDRPRAFLPLAAPCSGKPGRARFLWASLDADGAVRPVGRDAAQVRGPALAQALIRIPEGEGDVAAGERVETWLLGE